MPRRDSQRLKGKGVTKRPSRDGVAMEGRTGPPIAKRAKSSGRQTVDRGSSGKDGGQQEEQQPVLQIDEPMMEPDDIGTESMGDHGVTPTPILSVHTNLGANVAESVKQKIIAGQYIDLSLLLQNTSITEGMERKLVINKQGEIVAKSQVHEKIGQMLSLSKRPYTVRPTLTRF